MVNRDQPDRLPNVVRVVANLGILLPGPLPEKTPASRRVANWQNDGFAWIQRCIEPLGGPLAVIGESQQIGFCDFG